MTLASHTDVALMENYLSKLLRDGKWWRLSKAFEYLSFLDNQSIMSNIDLFKYQFGLEKDWVMISDYETNQMNDLDSKVNGHGKISVFDKYYGVVLEYFQNYTAHVMLSKSTQFSLKVLPEGVDQYLKYFTFN